MDKIIETENITKKYGDFTAVDQVAISVGKGEIYGFLGLNGAGKTTTIRMLLGMVRPTSGAAYLQGQRVHAGTRALWNKVGYLVEIPYAYPELTVTENLEIIRTLRLIADPGVVDTVIDKLRLGPYRDRKAKNLSLGNAQRLGIAKAIIHQPDILVLDEPANGLDPAGIVETRELLLDLAQNHGVTVFISSHILGEISRFASRIGIIHNGKLVQELGADQLEQCRNRRLVLEVRDINNALLFLTREGFTVTIGNQGRLELTGEEAMDHPDRINARLVQAGYPPVMLNVAEEDLESYFLRVINRAGGAK
jgi:ABC-2 type transport system ATP-binding protein